MEVIDQNIVLSDYCSFLELFFWLNLKVHHMKLTALGGDLWTGGYALHI